MILPFLSSPSVSPRRAAKAFSLIEMVSVMAIITMVAGFTMPAMKGVTGGNKVDAGAAKLSDMLNLARSQAIALHTRVRFVVATNWTGTEADGNLRHVSLWAWQADSGQYLPLTKWEELPDGVVLEASVPSYVQGATYATADASTVRGSCVLADDAHDFGTNAAFSAQTSFGTIPTRYIEFTPTGGVNIPKSPDRQAIFVAVEGIAGAGLQITHTAQSGGHPMNWAQVNVDALTGHVHIYRP